MPQHNIFQWRSGRGWLVLSGGGRSDVSDDVSRIEASMLGHTISQGPIAYIWAASDIETADRDMDALRELGARTGYLIDILTEDDDALFTQLSEAGVIILGDGPDSALLRDALPGIVMDGIESAFSRGATVYAVGQSAALLGTYGAYTHGMLPGIEWLSGAVIMPDFVADKADLLRDYVRHSEADYGLGLGFGAAIAFGPRGEIEVWGNQAITVSLGEHYGPDDGRAR